MARLWWAVPTLHTLRLKERGTAAFRQRWRRWWLAVHRWLGLALGFLFVLLGLSGSCNVFTFELDALLNPPLRVEPQPGGYRPLNDVVAAVRAAHPGRDGAWLLFMPRNEASPLRAVYPKPQESAGKAFAPLTVNVNPYTAEVLDSRFWGEGLMTTIYELHASLWLGKYGDAAMAKVGFKTVGALGVLLAVSLASGLYLWWPRPGQWRRALTVKRHAGLARSNFDLHRALGAYSALLLLVLAFTGFSFAYRDWLVPLVAWFSPVAEEPFKNPPGLKSTPLPGVQPISPDQAAALAERVFPGAELRWLALPDGPQGYYAVEKRQPGEANIRRPRSKVWLDQYSGAPLKVADPRRFSAGETFLNLMWPLHNGEALGLPGRILVCLAGLAPLLLYASGIIHWLQKRRNRRRLG